jgi:hypothetical protein
MAIASDWELESLNARRGDAAEEFMDAKRMNEY